MRSRIDKIANKRLVKRKILCNKPMPDVGKQGGEEAGWFRSGRKKGSRTVQPDVHLKGSGMAIF